MSTKDRTKNSVFWKEDYPCPIRRCSWFYQSNVTGRWVPYSEPLAQEFEAEYNAGFASGSWSRKLELEEPGEYVMFHSSTVMLHFPKTSHSKLDDWGQVQPPADPMMKPRVMHRGLEGLPGKLTNTISSCAIVPCRPRETVTCELSLLQGGFRTISHWLIRLDSS